MLSLRGGVKFLFYVSLVSFYFYATRLPDDPDEFKNFQQISEQLNYPIQNYQLYTKSGYQIEVYRIQKKNRKEFQNNLRPILLLHGLNCDCNLWSSAEEKNAIPYILANEGYDIWLSNFRGTTQTMNHLEFQYNSKQFWNYTFDDISQEDLPLIFEFVFQKIGEQNISVVSHSLGGTILLASLSQNLIKNSERIEKAFLMGPAFYMHETDSQFMQLLQKTAQIINLPYYLNNYLGKHDLSDKILHALVKYTPNFVFFMLQNTIDFSGENYLDKKRFLVLASHFPAGASMKLYEHVFQMIGQEKFQKFDYLNEKSNLLQYQQKTPPQYDFSKITNVEIHFFGGKGDLFSSLKDLNRVQKELTNVRSHVYEIEHGHIAYILPKNISHIQKIVDILKQN